VDEEEDKDSDEDCDVDDDDGSARLDRIARRAFKRRTAFCRGESTEETELAGKEEESKIGDGAGSVIERVAKTGELVLSSSEASRGEALANSSYERRALKSRTEFRLGVMTNDGVEDRTPIERCNSAEA
jgi:hypothetical protein